MSPGEVAQSTGTVGNRQRLDSTSFLCKIGMTDILHLFQTRELVLRYVDEGSCQDMIGIEGYPMVESLGRLLVWLLSVLVGVLECSSALVRIVVSWVVHIHCSRDWT